MKFDELICEFQNNDFENFCNFVKKQFHDKYILSNKDFLYWQYKNNKKNKLSIDIIKYNEKILGYLGIIQNKFSYFGNQIQSKCFANLMIDKSIRKIGLGASLIKNSEKNSDILYLIGYNSNVAKVYKQLDWNINFDLNRFIYIINNINTSELSLIKIEKSNIDYNANNKNFKIEKINSFDNYFNLFWEKIKNKYSLTVYRDKNYLKWRFENHPILKYDIFKAIYKNEIVSYIILRIEKFEKYKVARIIDFISYDDFEKNILYEIIKYYKKEKIDFIDFFFTGNFHMKSLKKIGFENAQIYPYNSIPMLFNPIDRKRKTINFSFKLINKKLYNENIYNINNWYITKADGDQDRPNILL